MTKSQVEVVQIIFDSLTARNIKPNKVTVKDIKVALDDSGKRAPWKLIEGYGKDGSFDLTELFNQALGLTFESFETEVSVPTPDPVSDSEEEIITSDMFDELGDEEELAVDTVQRDTTVKKKRDSKKVADLPESKKLHFKDPVYLVQSIDCSGEVTVVGITASFTKVWDKLVYRALKDHGTMDKEEALYEVETKGGVMFSSSNARILKCIIEKMELE